MEEEELPVRSDVSLSIHPGVLEPLRAVFEPAGYEYPHAREALAALYRYCASLEDAARALHELAPRAVLTTRPDGSSAHLGDLRVTPGGRMRVFSGYEEEYSVAATAAYERVAKEVDTRLKTLRARREEYAAQIEKALEHTGHSLYVATQAQEIRGYLRALPSAERLKFFHQMRDAPQEHARQVFSAALHAPRWLSALGPEEVPVVRAMAEQRFAYVEAMRRDALDKMITHVEKARELTLARKARAEALATTAPARAKKALAGIGGAA